MLENRYLLFVKQVEVCSIKKPPFVIVRVR